ncbi:MAG: hypothetical protein KGL46_09940 [Hyphomicrobiales bacterium]|nr:hypothetical protein [Hyphomicrobiales bacterium]
MSASLTLALLVPFHGAIAADWARMSNAHAGASTVPASVSSIWASAIAENRATVTRNTGRYLPPNIGWARIQTSRGPVVITTLESKCEAPNGASASNAMICSYVIASENQAFSPVKVSGCYIERDKSSGTDIRYDSAKDALNIRIFGAGAADAGCASSVPLPH